ncbi:helix-turn-helix domain-containing protein [Chitinasiproducens palmae]|uniref:Helix-turn-helix n=1 Tax=Chitinasiproducens palmae TaxID=1770053 RepID=A0A1H2PRJ4_9BURK|nr:helix-turn-helix transcriptional regulator [Chitinasiproducens palmae]SDV48688.1 Helix-turn-helix [Chitinasiproducens palmae]
MSYSGCYDDRMATSHENLALRLADLIGPGRPFKSGNQLAKALGQHQRAINRYINLEVVPTLAAVDQIAQALGVEPAALIGPIGGVSSPVFSPEIGYSIQLLRQMSAEAQARAAAVLEALARDDVKRNISPAASEPAILYKHTVPRHLEDVDLSAEEDGAGSKGKGDTRNNRR